MISQEISLLPADNGRLSNFCGQFDAHLRQIESRLQVEIANRGNQFKVTGLDSSVKAACALMQKLFASTEKELLTSELIHLAMQDASIDEILDGPEAAAKQIVMIKTKRGIIKGRGANQQDYLNKIMSQ